ncbi:MAG TPA: hypothetical protein VFS75_00415 [Candidatus Paceibacterota bacterium]|nr:hypothetical protein [Candidatus Paceibacterota bacterium]
MKDLAGIIGFIIILMVFSVYTEGHPITGDDSTPLFSFGVDDTSTPAPSYEDETIEASDDSYAVTRLSPREIEERLAELEDELDAAKKDAYEARLRQPASPYQGLVTLGRGDSGETSLRREYVTLQTAYDSPQRVDVTGWTLESYITGERAVIPKGDRIVEDPKDPSFEHIVLYPGETAYVITGRSPIGTSFHENQCTGYLDEDYSVYPALDRMCPDATKEMERWSTVTVTDDECYDFMRSVYSCEIPDEDVVDDAHLSSACRRFVLNELTYDSCVQHHALDPLFDDVGYWYVYLGRGHELWRVEREVIRLLDGNGKVVDVVEY